MGESKPKKPFQVRAAITISLNAQVYARTEEEACALAADLSLPDIHENRRYREPGESDDEWRTSGELDGEPGDIQAEESDESDDE